MKTNLSNLMNIVAEDERKFNEYAVELRQYVYNISIQELNGTVNVIEEHVEDFTRAFSEYKKLQEKIIKMKSLLYEKNNTFKLSDGRTIQEAIVENTMLRKMKATYEILLSQKNSKRRITEVNNSYFECKMINFEIENIRAEYQLLEKQIQDTDFEISKLNSIEFEINL